MEEERKYVTKEKLNRDNLVRHNMPEFIKAVESEGDTIMMDIAAFDDKENPYEYQILGAAVWYACTRGKNVMVLGKTIPLDSQLDEPS